MTGRLQLIEQKLIAIDPAGFQNLCDAYLILREDEYSSLNRTGSQLGKQKTVLGTPDSFMRTFDNKLAYIEYTTQAESKATKIISDIDKCLDPTKTGVENENVYQIIICFNSRLTIEEEVQIQSYANTKNIRIELIGIDTLALEIISKYMLLSRDFLGIPIDTGQILPFNNFISEYNNKAHQLSTPLDNIFLHREKELEEILNQLQSEDLLIVSGAPGVGKTKICIESINRFTQQYSNFQAFAISKKDVDIFDDLKIQLKNDKDYILLIDDANRQLSNLSQIIGVFREIRVGKIKIVISVRNYALTDISKVTRELKSHTVNISKFTDNEIIKILESDTFEILNNKYQKKIVEISDGNARLAIMGARLANEKQAEFLWGDVSDLFDSYFDKFLGDFDLFENQNLLKTLAIISFFFAINRDDKPFVNKVLEFFEIDYYSFNEAIEELHKRELIEVQYNHARISEQVMATYFFYKVFIKDGSLSFRTLLFNFFDSWKSRFKDSIIPANNSFGYENVISKINGTLDEYLNSQKGNEEKILNFLDLFWFYKPEDTLSIFYNKTSELPEPENPIYSTHYETNDFVYDKEQTIDFISRFYDHNTESLKPAIELGFEYIRKRPVHLPEFIRRIREHFLFDEPDERIGFIRQSYLIEIIRSNVEKGQPHYISAFFALSKTFLKHTFQNTHGGRKHTFTWYDYPLPFNEVTKGIRTRIWQTLFDKYEKYPDEVFEVIQNFKSSHHEMVSEIMDYDLSLLIPFIQLNFSPLNFKHVYFIHDMIYWTDREEKITNRTYRDLKQMFLTQEYLDFCKFDWNRLRDKNSFEFDDFREYEKLKASEIRKNFTFSSELDFTKLFTAISNVLIIKDTNHFTASNSVDIIIEENFVHNNDLGFKLFQSILTNYPVGLNLLYKTLNIITNHSQEWCSKLWAELENWDNENSLFWRISFFNYIPDEYINDFYCQKLLETIENIESYAYLYVKAYSRFSLNGNNIVKKILYIISEKIQKLDITITFDDEIFEKDLDLFENDYNLLKQLYFQQHRFNHSQIFDYKRDGFNKIFEQYPIFLIDFISEFYTNRKLIDRKTNLKIPFIWNSEDNLNLIESACEILIKSNPYFGIGDHSINILFNGLNDNQKQNAAIFIQDFIEKNKEDSKRIELIFDAIRHCMNNKFEEFLLQYLTTKPKLEIFKAVNWVGSVGVQNGDVSFGELYANLWKGILEIVKKSDDQLAMIPIKSFLKKQIENQYKWAESEREHKFLRPDW